MYRTIQASAHQLGEIADGSIQAILTSPPYYGLRKYEGEQMVEWPAVAYSPMAGLGRIEVAGCDPACEHEWGGQVRSGKYNWEDKIQDGSWDRGQQKERGASGGNYCRKCGGWRGPLGLEPTVEMYIGHLILCLREWHRVLRPDGLCFVNLGASYNGSGGSTTTTNLGRRADGKTGSFTAQPRSLNAYKPKDMIPVPWLFALAAQADGWYLRNDIIWHKPSVTPSSTTDRFTIDHEYVFMLAKSQRYYFDMYAVLEPAKESTKERDRYAYNAAFKSQFRGSPTDQRSQDGKQLDQTNFYNDGHRHPRTVWSINPRPYRGAHYAVWPPALAEKIIKCATSAQGCCPVCGAPIARVVKSESASANAERDWQGVPEDQPNRNHAQEPKKIGAVGTPTVEATGWRHTCQHEFDHPASCVVLDPFVGSGTTLMAAEGLGRDSIGVDISQDYLDEHVQARAGLFSVDMLAEKPCDPMASDAATGTAVPVTANTPATLAGSTAAPAAACCDG